ncbi:MAG: phosphodiesterase [gamma proteobacterium symbiont of Phacoides pectinatus]
MKPVNLQAHAPPGTPVRVLQLSDCHLHEIPGKPLAGLDTLHTLRQVVALAATQSPGNDLILVTGDISHDGHAATYTLARSELKRLPAPFYGLPGNHDDASLLSRHLMGHADGFPREIILGDWLVLLLDSTLPGSPGGHLREEELRRLDQSLSRHPDLHVLIALHHQPLPSGCDWLDAMALNNADELFAVTDRYSNVRAILWGHIHQQFEGWRGAVRMMGCPSTCIQFAPGKADFALDDLPPGYRWLELRPDGGIDSAVVRLPATPGGLDLDSPGY